MLNNYPAHLRPRVLNDLTVRAQGGVYVYLLAWLVSTLWADLPSQYPVFFYANTLILSVFFLLRLVHYWIVKRTLEYNVDVMSRVLILTILSGALHWGILSAWIFYNPELSALETPYIIMLAAFTIGGTVTLSISREIRLLYPLLMYIPGLLEGFLFDQTALFLLFFVLTLVSYIYVLVASKASGNDYYNAITNEELAAERARTLEELSNIDPLTQLKNRMYFGQKFTEEWERASRQQIPLAVMMLDLDHFKKINDTFGHIYGDQCLKQVAAVLQVQLPRSTDTIARYGGEEFVILLTNTSLDAAEKIAERLVTAVSEIKLVKEEKVITVTCSIGVASTVPDYNINRELLLIAADSAMYQAKANGRNQWVTAEVNF